MKVKDHISYRKVRVAEQIELLQAFASKIDHVVTDMDLMFPILMVHWNGRLIGYIKIMNNMVGVAAWSNEGDIPPRIFKKAFEELMAWAKINAELNNQIYPGFIAKSDDTPLPDKMLEMLGMADTGFRLFEIPN